MKKQRKKQWTFSYSQKIMLTASAIVLVITLFLSLTSWRMSFRLFEQQEVEILRRSTKNTSSQISNTLEVVQKITINLVHSDELIELYKSEDPDSEKAQEYTAKLSEMISSVISSMSSSTTASIQFISVFLDNGFVCSSLPLENSPYQDFESCVSAFRAGGIESLEGYVPTCWVDSISFLRGPHSSCMVGMRFLYENVTLNKFGVVVIGITQTGVQRAFDDSISGSCLVRSDGKILSSAVSRDIGNTHGKIGLIIEAAQNANASHLAELSDGSSYLVYRMPGGTAWTICPVEENLLNKTPLSAQYAQQVLIITIIAIAVAILFMWLLSKGLTRSLVQLKNTVQKVYSGNLKERFHTDKHDEIAYLGLKINDMLDQVENSLEIQARDTAEKQDLELQLMRAQINPHLLYNTLNSALWIIRQKDTEKAEHLILSLGNFFKLALSKGNDEIPLSNEIAMIQYYLDIQNLGRGKNYVLHDEVDEASRSCRILRLSLQIAVENSVIHGFSGWRDDGEITISAERLEGDRLCISVTDNGIGILPEELKAIRSQIDSPPDYEKNHYGLYNVNRRIQNKYGESYGVSVESEVGVYTKVLLTIPFKKDDPHD